MSIRVKGKKLHFLQEALNESEKRKRKAVKMLGLKCRTMSQLGLIFNKAFVFENCSFDHEISPPRGNYTGAT